MHLRVLLEYSFDDDKVDNMWFNLCIVLLIERSMTKDYRLLGRRRRSIQQLWRLLSVNMTNQSTEKGDCDVKLYQRSGLALVQPPPMKQDDLQTI